MGAATFIEKAHSTDYVHEHIYGAWWFVALWGVLAVAGIAYYIVFICKSGFFKQSFFRGAAGVGIHLAFSLILAGALCTYLFGFNGYIHLRNDMPESMMIVQERGRSHTKLLPFKVQLDEFKIKEDESGRVVDYICRFSIYSDGERKQCVVSMNNICKYNDYRFYQSSYDDDLCGSVLSINHDSYGIIITYTGYFLLFVSFLLLVIKDAGAVIYRRRTLWLMLAVVALTALWCLDYFVLDGSWRDIPVLRHPLLAIHVLIIILAYAVLLVMAVISVVALVRKTQKQPGTLLLKTALGLLCGGIFIGAMWANVSWGNYWSWDAKETWALITLMVYAVPAHRRSFTAFNNPKIYHAYIFLAFLTILMTYFGVNYFLTGMHSYV